MPRPISRDEAWDLLREWVASESLRRHCLAVEAAMRAYAGKLGGDEELWGVTGLLHDADYERFPDMDDTEHGHPRSIMAHLESLDAPPGDGPGDRLARRLPRRQPRLADGEGAATPSTSCRGSSSPAPTCGPRASTGMTPKSVKKKLKTPAFAAAVNRDDVRHGAEELGVELRRARRVRHRRARGAQGRAGPHRQFRRS